MTQHLGTRAAIGWSSTGDALPERLHRLAVPLRELRPAFAQTTYVAESLDKTTREVFTLGSGVREFEGTARFDDDPHGLMDLVAAGNSGKTLTYYPDLRDPGVSYACSLIAPSGEALLADLDAAKGRQGNVAVTIRLRPTTASQMAQVYQGTNTLLWYRAGGGLTGWGFTRTSTATGIGKGQGTVTDTATGTVRLVYVDLDADGVRETPALLTEEARSNYWSHSELLGDASWASTGVQITSNTVAAPDGNVTAELVSENTSTGLHSIGRGPATSVETTAVVSAFVKQAGRTLGYWRTTDRSNTVVTSTFDLAAGTITAAAGHTAWIEKFAGDWWRVTVAWTPGSGATTPEARVGFRDSGGNTTYTGDGSSGMRVWGMQWEGGSTTPSTYIHTSATGVTRAVDSLEAPNLTAKPQAMTWYVRFTDRGTGQRTVTTLIMALAGGFVAPGVDIYHDSGGYKMRHANGTTVSDSTAPLTSSLHDLVELCGQVSATGAVRLLQSVNSGAVQTGTQGQAAAFAHAWSNQQLWLGNNSGATNGDGTGFLNIVIVRGVQDMATMRRIARL